MNIRRKHIQELADSLLSELRIVRPPVDVEKIARARNAIIHRGAVEKKVSGYLFREARGRTAVIGVNNSQHEHRQRFTIAHELGHFLLHSGEDLHLDQVFVVKNRDERSAEGEDLEEVEANLFAAELLMPEQFLRRDVEEMKEFDFFEEIEVKQLADLYKVSQQAMVIRLTHLGYLSI
ncbi:MAG: ImmA/IrrE family metallo-endopeptidase [Verrucomicrobiota bacterium]